jgi:hypothetical protein
MGWLVTAAMALLLGVLAIEQEDVCDRWDG